MQGSINDRRPSLKTHHFPNTPHRFSNHAEIPCGYKCHVPFDTGFRRGLSGCSDRRQICLQHMKRSQHPRVKPIDPRPARLPLYFRQRVSWQQ